MLHRGFVLPEIELNLWVNLGAPFAGFYAFSAALHDTESRGAMGGGLKRLAAAWVCGAAVALAAWSAPGFSIAFTSAACFAGLVYFAVFDLRTMTIPVFPVLGFATLGLSATLITLGMKVAVLNALCAVIGFAAFELLGVLFRYVRGVDGIGKGDSYVAAALAAWLGGEGLAWSVVLGGFVGLGWGALVGRSAAEPFPLVPPLVAGAFLVHIIGHLFV